MKREPSCVEKILRENKLEEVSMVTKFVIPDLMGSKMASFRDVVAFLNAELSDGARGQGHPVQQCTRLNTFSMRGVK